MATKSNIEQEIQQRVAAFAAELGNLIRQSVFTNLQQTLGMGGTVAAAASAAAPAAPQAKAGKAKGKPGRPKGSGGAASADAILAYVKANPGSRIEQIAKGVGKSTAALKNAVGRLVAEGALAKAGQRRGTNYSIGDGTPVAAAPAAEGAAAPAKKAGKKGGKRGRPAKTMTKKK